MRTEYLLNGCLFTDTDFRVDAIKADHRWNPITADPNTLNFKQFMNCERSRSLITKQNRCNSQKYHLNEYQIPIRTGNGNSSQKSRKLPSEQAQTTLQTEARKAGSYLLM
jgi:hypothetical protein